jgi:choline/glycine/proline betaine transport protein
MGIGLLFWSISEPIYHFLSPPMAEGGTAEAAKEAEIYFLTLGFSWAVYALVGLSLAYFTYSRGLHLLLGLFYQEIKFTVGDAIDISVLAVFGLATSLGWEFNKLQQG